MGMRSEHENLKSHINTLRVVIFGMFIVVAALWLSLQGSIKTQSVSIPPDLRSGATVELGKAHPANVFAFTSYIFQMLNDWPVDGSKDYGKNIYKLQAYLSKSYMEKLLGETKLKGARGELEGRTRQLKLLAGYDEQHVDIISDTSWVVWLDIELTEHVKGLEIKRLNIRYPIKIKKIDSQPDTNPWGLIIDGYTQPPFELKDVAK
jgi:integrating conjugative element protein (TIGR03746 family)